MQKPAVCLSDDKAYSIARAWRLKRAQEIGLKQILPYLNASIIMPAPISASASHSRRLGRSPKNITAMITTSTTLSLSIGAT